MPTTLFTTWYDEVLTKVVDCPQEEALAQIRNSAIEFCELTRAWVYEHPDLNLVEDAATITLTPPAGTSVVCVLQAHNKQTGRELDEIGIDEAALLHPNWKTWSGSPLYYTSLDLTPGTVRLVPVPDASVTGGFHNAIVALKPTRAATGIDSKLYDEYMETIALGALYRLQMVNGRPYTDVKSGVFNRADFNRQCTRIYNKVMRAFTRNSVITFTR